MENLCDDRLAMFNLGDRYGRRRVCYIRKGHGDPLKFTCVKSDSFAPGCLSSAVISFYGKTEIWIIPKGVKVNSQYLLAKF